MRFKAIKKVFHEANQKSAEGVDRLIENWSDKMTDNVEIDPYLDEFKNIRPDRGANHTEMDAYLEDFESLKPQPRIIKKIKK